MRVEIGMAGTYSPWTGTFKTAAAMLIAADGARCAPAGERRFVTLAGKGGGKHTGWGTKP